VVVASDVSHFYENMESGRPFTTAFHVGQMLEGFDRLFALAPTRAHIVPGHDPEVMRRYPAPWPELEGIVVRLDVAPNQGSQPGITWRTACGSLLLAYATASALWRSSPMPVRFDMVLAHAKPARRCSDNGVEPALWRPALAL
jgi:glyoxylase-like metal-dependent hydrolase (beta-lactamase superfamily II)